jgi:A/G-specific adenine glycosylase
MLLRTRPPTGLLGGMTEVPTTAWEHEFDLRTELAAAPEFSSLASGRATHWHRLPGVVSHIFTHFPLELTVYAAEVPGKARAPAGARWVPLAELSGEALPNVMRKVIAHAMNDQSQHHNKQERKAS